MRPVKEASMNIAVIDDNLEERFFLRGLLEQAARKSDLLISINEYSSADTFLKSFEPELFDLCFMDIFMSGTSGMEAVRLLRETDKDCFVVFLTNSPDYVYEGYEVNAFRYLLKPVKEEVVQQILKLCTEQTDRIRKRLTVSINKKNLEIPYGKILYVMSAGKSVELHLENEILSLSARHTFSRTVAPLLTDSRFLTCGRGIVVNLHHVKELLKDSFLMQNGDRLPVSRRLYASVNDTYMDYQFDHLS